MTGEQVIKALECCTKKYGCRDCPLANDDLCRITINKEALNLIKRQQAEIEALINGQETLQKMCAEAYKYFAEKLKSKTYPFPCAIGVENAVTIRAINDLVKELTEASK